MDAICQSDPEGADVGEDRALSPATATALTTLQLGGGWFPEQGGGLNRYYFDLLHALPAVGVRCEGLVAGTPSRWPRDAHVSVRAFAPLESSLPRRWLAVRKAVAGALSGGRMDLAVSHFAPYAFPVLRLIGSRRPMVVHFHGPWAQESQEEGAGWAACAAKRAIERAVYRRANRLIVLSAAFKQMLIRDYQIDAARIDIVPGGVDCARFDIEPTRPDARAALGWPSNRPIVLTVRRLVRRMGLENLIAAADRLRKFRADVLVLVAGSGPLRGELAAQIHRLGLSEHVRLLGFVPDEQLPLAYRAADVTILPSVALEGFGLTAAESLAAGTPVLVMPVGGLPEVVSGLDRNLVLPDAQIESLAAALAAAVDRPASLPDSSACQRHVRENFSWAKVAMRLKDSYAEAQA